MTAPASHTIDDENQVARTGQFIVREQDAPYMLELLRAKSGVYDSAQKFYRAQFVVSVTVPVVLIPLQTIAPQFTAATLVATVAVFLLDWGLLERIQNARKALGARFQEQFDCTLFRLPWREDRVGPQPAPEDIRRWANAHNSVEGLRGWYPSAVADLPYIAAVAVCQRANGTWNANMRERYGKVLYWSTALLLLIIVCVAGFARVDVFTCIWWIGLSMPLLSWLLREGSRQRISAADSRKVAERARKLWLRILSGESTDTVIQEIRELQNDIYDMRRRDQQVPAFAYDRFREEDEDEMRDVAEHLVAEYRRTRQAA